MNALFSNHPSNNGHKKEKSLIEILQIVFRRRYVLIFTVIVFVMLAVTYNYLATPVYQAVGLLKKEVAPKDKNRGDFSGIIDLQTLDELETEMELVKTWNVLGNVIDELKLNIIINSMIASDGETIEIGSAITYFSDPSFIRNYEFQFDLPEFKKVELKKRKKSGYFYIKKTGSHKFEIYDATTNTLLQVSDNKVEEELDQIAAVDDPYADMDLLKGVGNFDLPIANLEIYWDAPIGSIVHFDIKNFYKAVDGLKKKIKVEKRGKTNVFKVAVKSSSAFVAALIANTVIDKFRASRINQQKETIRYSFKFVDEQLNEMKQKLKDAEENLSRFKASGHITTIDQSSRDLVKFMTNLETEKVNTDLLLEDYKNKVAEMKDEMAITGYIDQSHLAPQGNMDRSSPFSALLKQLTDLELQRLELLQKRTENHPDVTAVDDAIFLAKQKLSTYNENTLTAYQIIIASLEKKLLKINNLMSKYEVKLEMLPAKENRLAQLMRRKNVYEKISTLLLDKREEMRIAELSKLQDIAVVDEAHEPLIPISPRKMFNLMVAVVLGGFFGLVGIFLLELRDSKLVNLDELENEFNLPIFAIIPTYSREIKEDINNTENGKQKFVTLMDEGEGFRETYRLLKTKLLFQMNGSEKIFMVTSCEENTGKTSVVANLAISIAQENKRVLIVDCDLRKAELSKMFGIPKKSPGLIEFIEKEVSPTIYTKLLKNIDILPAGGRREDSSHLLNSERMKMLFKSFDTSMYDSIIIDTPPVTRVVDTLVLGQSIQDAILVVRPGHSFKEAVVGGIQEMQHAKIKIQGVVVNAAEIRDSYYYRYRYGYGYGYNLNETNGKDSKKKTDTVEAST
ncbi:MAG: polysaccharide biosynthesis tyrosine autokinase [Ignavibacterium sp.]|nr:MAG: polysaccharide biosynthesis tyrosine autokinase [Ignavibacterium sp.]